MAGLKVQLDTTAPIQGPLVTDNLNRLQVVAPTPPTFRALYRLTTRPYAISVVAGASSRTQVATIHHSAAAVKKVTLRHVWVAVESASIASICTFDLSRLTSVPTGGTVISPAVLNGANLGLSEAVCLLTPTAGTEFSIGSGVSGNTEFNLGATATAPTTSPPPDLNWRDLINLTGYQPDLSAELPLLLPGVLGGWAVVLDSSAAATIKLFVIIEFTEE